MAHIYCANVGSVAGILSIYCPYCCKYIGHEIIFGRDTFKVKNSVIYYKSHHVLGIKYRDLYVV